jgi:hypothetical protein
VQPGVMRTLLERALQQNQLIEETQRLNRQLSYRGVLDEMTGDSPSMQEVFSLVQQVAPTTASVFISRERNRQGTCGPCGPSAQFEKRGTVRGGELRRAARHTRRERTLRTREGCVYRRRRAPRGVFRAG